MTAIDDGTNRSEFTYDSLGRRVRMVEKVNGTVTSDKSYLWEGGEIIEERQSTLGGATTKRYFPQGVQEMVSGTATNYFYTRDHLGSIREMTDQSGAVVAKYLYDPWGRQTKVSGTKDADFGYCGYWKHQPTGLNLTWYRAYDPNLGRWLSRDPIGERGGLNLYGYVFNNPFIAIDSDGTFPKPPGVLCINPNCKKDQCKIKYKPEDPDDTPFIEGKAGECYFVDAVCTPRGLLKIPGTCKCSLDCAGGGFKITCQCWPYFGKRTIPNPNPGPQEFAPCAYSNKYAGGPINWFALPPFPFIGGNFVYQ